MKISLWWRRLFFGHEERVAFQEALKCRREYEASLVEEKIFLYAALQYMLRKDFTRFEILAVLLQGEDNAFKDAVNEKILEMNDGIVPPELTECPVIDFPMILDIKPDEKATNADSVSEGSCTAL
ncbi:hypothetical protein pEaSNUABM29_00018 [Erwinia phage pEa_SNUABM_29]|nr:hypothetical protein pEaSNUABM29_00018 [Erwinia phage pEa_SNUABM_29]